MTPFLQFRIWFRRASAAQQVSTVLAVAVVIALLVWTAVPSSTHSSTTAVASGASGGQATAGSGTGSSSSGASSSPGGSTSGGSSSSPGSYSSSSGGSQVSGSSTSPSGSTSPGQSNGNTGTGPTGSSTSPTTAAKTAAGGCTKMGTLKIGVVVPEGAGGSLNAVIGNPPTSQEEADYAAVFDAVDKAGGVDCYDLVGDYATSDLTDPSSAQSGCLQFQQDKDFAVLGGYEPTFTDDCLLQAHLPTIDELAIPAGAVKQYYPYYFSSYSTYEVLYENFVQAVNQMGYFGSAKGFSKLGIFYKDCSPEVNQALLSDLAAVGVSGSKVVTDDLGCPSEFASPSDIESGIIKFKTDGVTTVTIDNDIADSQTISTQAASQDFYPKWILPDDGIVAVTGSANFHPNAKEFGGAVAITSSQYGAIASNLPLTAGTQACNQIMTSHSLPTVYDSGDAFAGSTCTLVWMLVAAIQHGGVSQTNLVAGLQAAKTTQVSFPNGPDDFSTPGTTTGGEYWRALSYGSSCQCWSVQSATFHPSFT